MLAEEYFNLYKTCVDTLSIQFTLQDFKKFTHSKNIKILKDKNCIAILGLTDSEVEIYFIGVAKSYRSRGLGKKLMKNIIRFSKDFGASMIILEVRINNILAKNIYLSLNFKECGIRKNYYRDRSGLRQDAMIMKLILKS
jgi:ribosomal-protein-alanine N-acetyltransferase